MTDETGQPTLRAVRSYMDIGPPSSEEEEQEDQGKAENDVAAPTREPQQQEQQLYEQRSASADSQTYYHPPSASSNSSSSNDAEGHHRHHHHHRHGRHAQHRSTHRDAHEIHRRKEKSSEARNATHTRQPRPHSARPRKHTQLPSRRHEAPHGTRSLSGSTHTVSAADVMLLLSASSSYTETDTSSSSSSTSETSELSSSSETQFTLRVAQRGRRRRHGAAEEDMADAYDEAAGTSSEFAADTSSTCSHSRRRGGANNNDDDNKENANNSENDDGGGRNEKGKDSAAKLPIRRDTRSACVTEYDITVATMKARLQARLTADNLYVRQQLQQQQQQQEEKGNDVQYEADVHDATGNIEEIRRGIDAVYRRHMDALVETYLSAPVYRTARALFRRRLPRAEQRLRQDIERSNNTISSGGGVPYAWTQSDVEMLVANSARRGRFMDDTLPWRPIDFALTDLRLETLELPIALQHKSETGRGAGAGGGGTSMDLHAGRSTSSTLAASPVLGGCVNRLIEVLLLTEVDVPFAGSSMEINYTNVFLLLCPLFISAEVLVSKLIRFFRSVRRWQRGEWQVNRTGGGQQQQQQQEQRGLYASPEERTRSAAVAAAAEERSERAVYLQCRVLQCLLAFCRAYETDLTLSCLQRMAYFAERTGLCANAFGELDKASQRWPCSIGRCATSAGSAASHTTQPHNVNTSSVSLLPPSSGFLTPVDQGLTSGEPATLDLPVMQLFADLTHYLTHIIHKHYRRIEAGTGDTAADVRRYTLVDTGVPRDRVSTVALHSNSNSNSSKSKGSPTGLSEPGNHAYTHGSAQRVGQPASAMGLVPPSSSASSSAAYASAHRHTSSSCGRGPMDAMLGSGLLVVRHGRAEVMPMSHWVRGGSAEEQWWHVLRAFDIDAEQFAHQLCLLSFSIFVNIPLRELMQHTWNDPALMLPTPHHLRVMLEYNARVQLWTAAVIVTQLHWDDCWRSLQHLLEVCRWLYDMQNYEMASAVLQGLCHPAVQLLEKLYAEKHTHAMLSAKAERERATLRGLMDPFASYSPSSLNSIIARTAGDMETPLIPILAPILTQLRRYELTQGSTITLRPRDGQLVVNWTKLMSVGSFASLWLRCQHTPYVFPMDPMLQDYLWSIKNHTWTDEMLLQMAQREKNDST